MHVRSVAALTTGPLALLALLASLSGCHSSGATGGPTPSDPEGCGADPSLPPHVPAAIERDLVLELSLSNAEAVRRGEPVEIAWTVRNRSATTAHRIVQGGDGSECGWREPVLEIAAESLGADGEWRPIARRGYGRCGVYDPVWRDDVATIAPGGSLAIGWVPWVAAFFDLSPHERVRFTATYRYTRGAAGKGIIDERMRSVGDASDPGIPAFTLVSAPLEVVLARVAAAPR